MEQYKSIILYFESATRSTSNDASFDAREIAGLNALVNLKNRKMKESEDQIQKLKLVVAQATEDQEMGSEVQTLTTKVNELNDKLKGRAPLIGAKHALWDSIIAEITKFRPYLEMIEDKVALASKALHRRVVLNETMAKKTTKVAQKIIDILNNITNEQVRVLGVKDKAATIIITKRIITKNAYLDEVKVQDDVKAIKDSFDFLLKKGLPSFSDKFCKLIPQKEYHDMLVQVRMDASRFQDLEKILLGNVVINKLLNHFEILDRFKILVHKLPPLSFASCITLEVLIKEMTDHVITTDEQWK